MPKNQHTQGNYRILRIGLVGASEVFKNQSFKSQLFSSSQEKILQIEKFPEYVDSLAKTFLIMYPPFENSTTRIAITISQASAKQWIFMRRNHREVS